MTRHCSKFTRCGASTSAFNGCGIAFSGGSWLLLLAHLDSYNYKDSECLARIVKSGKPDKIYFNYRSSFTSPWIAQNAQQKYRYFAVVRPNKDLSLRVEL